MPINFLYIWVHHAEIIFHQPILNQLFKLLSCETTAFCCKEPFLEHLFNSLEGPEGRSQKPSCFEGLRAWFWAFSKSGHFESSSHLCYLHSCECHVKTLDRYSLLCLTILLWTSITSINTSSCFTSFSYLLLFHYSGPCRNMLSTLQLKIHTIC